MRLNKKGGFGFTEAIMAAMIVTLVLSLYMGLLVLNTAEENSTPEVRVDHRIFSGLALEDGEVVGDIEMRLISEMERHGFRGISFACEIPGELGFNGRHMTLGDMDGKVNSERFVFLLRSDDGRTVPAVIEVAVCA
ncbi:MAG: hypothetical protein FWC29_05795 [Methanomassiliicoccaceae archaeon]|nr:hypothetical protein [Methanomassiliicoccaceae archaeon]